MDIDHVSTRGTTGTVFSEEDKFLNLVVSGMKEFATIRHGLILWENGATPLKIIFKYLQDLKIPQAALSCRGPGGTVRGECKVPQGRPASALTKLL